MIYILFAFLSGVTIVMSRILNFKLSDEIGLYQSTFFNFVYGLLASIVLFLISSEGKTDLIGKLNGVPIWMYLGGMVGVIVVSLSSYITPKISIFYMTILCFIGQIFVGAVIDYVTEGIFSIGKLVGAVFVLVGLIYNLRLDQKEETE